MIARTWRGWASKSTAAAYVEHFRTDVAGKLGALPGFHGGRLLRDDDGDEVRFTSLTYFTSIADVRAFAGPAYRQAVVAPAARELLSRWDEQAEHHDVAAEIPDPPRT